MTDEKDDKEVLAMPCAPCEEAWIMVHRDEYEVMQAATKMKKTAAIVLDSVCKTIKNNPETLLVAGVVSFLVAKVALSGGGVLLFMPIVTGRGRSRSAAQMKL